MDPDYKWIIALPMLGWIGFAVVASAYSVIRSDIEDAHQHGETTSSALKGLAGGCVGSLAKGIFILVLIVAAVWLFDKLPSLRPVGNPEYEAWRR